MTEINRRDLMAGSAAVPALALAAAGLALTAASSAPAQAEQAAAGQQVPSIYRYRIGSLEMTAVNDGVSRFALPDGFVTNASTDQVNTALDAAFLPKGQLALQFNPLLINTGGKLVLIDTGNGPQAGNASTGRLPANLAWAGVKPADIDTVIISHFHPDHINGLRTSDGALAFPNAEILVPAPEWGFWMDEGQMSRAAEGLQGNFKNVRRVFKDFNSRIKPYEWDKEIAPGITSIAAAGHTPGHTAFLVTSGDGKLLVQSDTTNLPALFVANPQWQVRFDMDGPMAVETRRRIYDMVVAERLQITGFHFPFPATGNVEKNGEGYRLVPAQWNPVL